MPPEILDNIPRVAAKIAADEIARQREVEFNRYTYLADITDFCHMVVVQRFGPNSFPVQYVDFTYKEVPVSLFIKEEEHRDNSSRYYINFEGSEEKFTVDSNTVDHRYNIGMLRLRAPHYPIVSTEKVKDLYDSINVARRDLEAGRARLRYPLPAHKVAEIVLA